MFDEAGYRALREGAAWLDLSARGRIRVTGEDRVRLLHAMSSNHVQQLKPGEGCYAFFLNAQGRILADAAILTLPDALLLDTEPETRLSLAAHLDKYIIADDVTLEDVTDLTIELGVEGPRAESVLGVKPPRPPWSHAAWGERIVVRAGTGFRIIAPAGTAIELAGAVPASAEAARIVRLEMGLPRYSEDITDRYLPQETQRLEAVHFNKGCYLGQEIVERVRARGGVHRFLERLEIDAAVGPAPGTKITAGGREVGEVTSAAYSPARGKVVALGYVRRNELAPGASLEVEGSAARLVR